MAGRDQNPRVLAIGKQRGSLPISNRQRAPLHDPDFIATAAAELRLRESCFAEVIEKYGLPPPRLVDNKLTSLLRLITFQLISLRAAEAIWQRVIAVLGDGAAERVLALSVDELRQLGLTRAKAESFLALAQAVHTGLLNFDELAEAETATVITLLTRHKGIGRWTAQLYALSALGHVDVMPEGDLALRQAAAQLFGLSLRPTAAELAERALGWAPYRSVAALLLWHYYSASKKSDVR